MTSVSPTGAPVGGKYRMLRELGRGPRGTVYLCHDVSDELPVSLKLPHPQLMASEEFRTQFWLELVAAGHLRSPHVLSLLTFGEDLELGTYYAAQPYVAQPDLATVLRENGALSGPLSADIIAQVLAALVVAHAADVLHLNIKPSNVFVKLDGTMPPRVRVADFGFSHLPDRFGRMGTPAYAAPEQAAGLVLDPRSDIYSVGVMLYELLAGRLPFEAASPAELVEMHCGTPPPPPSGFRRVPAALESVCLKALSKTPDARYQSAEEMLEAVEALCERRPSQARVPRPHDSLAPFEQEVPDPPRKIPRRRSGLAFMAAACLACATWLSYGDVARLIQPSSQARDTSHPVGSQAHDTSNPVGLQAHDTPKPVGSQAPEAAPTEAHTPSAFDAPQPAAPETPQLVATQNDAMLQPPAAAHVTLGVALPRTAASEQLRDTLDVAAMTECYRASVSQTSAGGQGVSGWLDLETTIDGGVHWARVRAPVLPAPVRKCIEKTALAVRVPDQARLTIGTSVQLEFSPN